MNYDVVIKNGRIISSGTDFIGDVAIIGEQIATLGKNFSGTKEIDATGKYVIPGAIDGHVHMRTERPSWRYDETFATGSVAAAFGGTTTMIDQVQAEYGRTLNEELDTRLSTAHAQTAIDYTFHMNIREPIPERIDEIPSIFDRGITSFKWFMAIEGWCVPDDFLLRGMYEVAAHGGLSIVHAENQGTIQELIRRIKVEGRNEAKWFNSSYPATTEGAAATLALAMAELAGGRILIFHVSCNEVVEAIRSAKARGVKAYGELGLAWALFTDDIYRGDPVSALPFLLTPPLRDADHKKSLWNGLADGTLDIVSTDHAIMKLAPEAKALELAASFGIHLTENDLRDPKWMGTDDIRRLPMLAPGGVEVRLPIMFSHGVSEGWIDIWRWVDVCCAKPAKVFDLVKKGHLLPGYDADIVIFDPNKEVTYSAKNLHSNTDYSVYEGMKIRGAVDKTISRGRIVVDGDQFLGDLDHGKFIPRAIPPK